MISNAAQARQDAYDQAVEALHRVDPNAVPVAKPGDVYAIARVSDQVRNTTPPADREPTPEHMLITRAINMQGAVAKLIAEAKRNGVPVSTPPDTSGDPGGRLQALNDYHYQLEKKVTYYSQTTPEQRAIDELRADVARLKKAMVALNDLLPLLMAKSGEPK
jgi:hypothetical protein